MINIAQYSEEKRMRETGRALFSSTEAFHIELEYNRKLTSLLGLYTVHQGNVGDLIEEINKWLKDKDNDLYHYWTHRHRYY